MSLWVMPLENRPWGRHHWPLRNVHVRCVCSKRAASVIAELLIGQHSSDQISGRWEKKEGGGAGGSDLWPDCGLLWLIRALSLAYFLSCQQELSVLIGMRVVK